MIDKNGNKIGIKKEIKDPNFILAEIKFMLKPIKNALNDSKAIAIAQKINDYLKLSDDKDKIIDVFSMLESHIVNTKSDDFLWELVYVQRKLAEKSESHLLMADHYCTSASYFEKICVIRPTVHNKCCRVLELVCAIEEYFEVNNSDAFEKAEKLLLKAEGYFLNIDDDQSSIYSLTGKSLFIKRYSCNVQKKQPIFTVLQTVVSHAQEYYFRCGESNALAHLVKIYKVFSKQKEFSLNDEITNIEKIVIHIKNNNQNGETEREALSYFNAFLE